MAVLPVVHPKIPKKPAVSLEDFKDSTFNARTESSEIFGCHVGCLQPRRLRGVERECPLTDHQRTIFGHEPVRAIHQSLRFRPPKLDFGFEHPIVDCTRRRRCAPISIPAHKSNAAIPK
jgi:hypothetical protein